MLRCIIKVTQRQKHPHGKPKRCARAAQESAWRSSVRGGESTHFLITVSTHKFQLQFHHALFNYSFNTHIPVTVSSHIFQKVKSQASDDDIDTLDFGTNDASDKGGVKKVLQIIIKLKDDNDNICNQARTEENTESSNHALYLHNTDLALATFSNTIEKANKILVQSRVDSGSAKAALEAADTSNSILFINQSNCFLFSFFQKFSARKNSSNKFFFCFTIILICEGTHFQILSK